MSGENSLRIWARQAMIGVGLFVSGAILAFGYSYRPLHGALSWQVDQLESRLDERNRENLQLSDEIARRKSVESSRIDPETLAQVERELEQTKRVLHQAEKDLTRAERRREVADASAEKWQKRFHELEESPTPVAAIAASPSSSPARTKRSPTASRTENKLGDANQDNASEAAEFDSMPATRSADPSRGPGGRGSVSSKDAANSRVP